MDKRLIILFLIFLLISPLESAKKDKSKNKKVKNKDENNNTKTKNDKENNKNTAEDGIYMSEVTFDMKLKEILEKRNLKPKKKITKEVLKEIYSEIYKKDFAVPNLPEEEASKIDAEFEAKRFMEEIFEKLCRGLDYDDKIRVSEIKDWISPKRAQESLTEVMERLEQMIAGL